MTYIAHSDGERKQTVKCHLTETAKLARRYAAEFGAEQVGEFCGLLHDIGKYSDAFQRRIQGANISVDHSTAGAIEAWNRRNVPAAFCIAGHHAGIPDLGNKADKTPQNATLIGRVSRKAPMDIDDYEAFRSEIDVLPCTVPNRFIVDSENLMFFTRMLFSCLVDADWIDTENFMKSGSVHRDGFEKLDSYAKKLAEKTNPWLSTPTGALGNLRNEILRAAIEKSEMSPGLFSLTAPTGSGKTLTGMMFALKHALKWKKRRVIYVIPYCSIIEQTQSVFEEVFGAGSVVAHYVNVEYETTEGGNDKRYLASENWDAPVILTTTVQFFESIYANRSSRCRKLHNIANSVLVFDEAQMLPYPFLRPCIHAISSLVKNYGCTAVMCTATQPALSKLFMQTLPNYPINEICPQPEEMYQAFRRVKYEKLGLLTDEALIYRLMECKQALCIVNRRDQAQVLFDALPPDGRFHLSTAMCPIDRRANFDVIRRRLKEGLTCRVVSTCMVEAGVDLDFPAVYRAVAGIDSIIQAGGRCNREGKEEPDNSIVYTFESERKEPRTLKQNVSSARMVMNRFEDIAHPDAVSAYFNDLLYVSKGMEALDEKKIIPMIMGGTYPFRDIANAVKLIDNSQYTVFIPHPQNLEMIEKLEKNGPSRQLMRKLGAYAVGVYPKHYNDLVRIGAIQEIANKAAILRDERLYDVEKGLELTIEEGISMFV